MFLFLLLCFLFSQIRCPSCGSCFGHLLPAAWAMVARPLFTSSPSRVHRVTKRWALLEQKSPLPDERQWGNMKSSNIVYLMITVSPRVKVRSSMRTSPPGFFEFMITMQYVPSDGMTNSCSTSVHSVFEILLM